MKKSIFFDLDNTLMHRIKNIHDYAVLFYQNYAQQLLETTPENIKPATHTISHLSEILTLV